jgi:PAS domain S-box-containing protein
MSTKPTYEELEQKIKTLEEEACKFRSAEKKSAEMKTQQGNELPQCSELELLREAALFRNLFDNMTSGSAIYEVGNDGSKGSDYIIKTFNNAALKMEGKTLEEVVGKSLYDLRPAIDDFGLIPVLQRVWQTGNPDFFPMKMYKDKSFSNYYENYVFRLPSGEVVTIYNDVTDRKNAEMALQLSEQKFKAITTNTPDHIIVMDKDLRYQMVVNPQLGLTEEDYLGKTDYDILTKEDADNLTNLKRNVLETGLSKYLEVPLATAKGDLHYFEGSYIPQTDEEGKTCGLIGYFRDVTDRKKAEDAFLENLRRYKKAQRLGQVGNWEYDILTEKFWASDESKRIYGFDADDESFSVDKVENCIPDRERVHKALVDLINHDEPYLLEFEIQPANGEEPKIIKSIGELVRSPEGKPLKVNGVIQNITQQKKSENEKSLLEKQLRQSQKLKSIGLLAGGIAHDFNNILTSIIGYATLALDDVEKGTEIEDSLQEVYKGGMRATSLVKQILTFARQSDVELFPITAATTIRDALKLIRSVIPTTIEISESIDSKALILADVTQLHQILMNLCTNAAHAMEDNGGLIEVTLKDSYIDSSVSSKPEGLSAGHYVVLSVSDSGTGIKPEVLASIFDPYYTTKSDGKGTGMGLAIVHGIVKSYKGEITVDTVEGKGTTFAVYLPVTGKKPELGPYEKVSITGGTERILLVDDEPAILGAVNRMLSGLGYDITTCSNGLEAIEIFRAAPNNYDVLITDMNMPQMAGDRLATEALKIRSDIKIILCTGYSDKITEKSSEQIGIKAFAYKPVVKADLARLIRQVLQ